MELSRPVYAEIDLDAIAENVQWIRRITSPGAKVMGVVKANGYGHGAVEVAKTVLENGGDWLGVAILEEGKALRKAGFDVPILILGTPLARHASEIVRYNLAPAVCTLDLAEALSAAAGKMGKKAKVHLKVDTGMGRIGISPDAEGMALVEKIVTLPDLEVEGIFTHFAAADEADKEYTLSQFRRFQEFIQEIERRGIHIPIKHAANSAATLDLPQMHLDMVRPGIILYGLYPSKEVERKIPLRPAMSLKAQIVFAKNVPAGTPLSYGRTFYTQEDSTVVTLPIGYADGFSRLLSNRGEVLIHGKRCSIAGRVCMDQCLAVYRGESSVARGDEAVLLGQQGNAWITADELAGKIGTINYEVVCMIGGRVPRVYRKGGEIVSCGYLKW